MANTDPDRIWSQSNRPSEGSPEWRPTHQHRKGGLYRVLAEGLNETDREAVVIYDDQQGQIWVRPTREFQDGRFTPVGRS